MAKSSRSSTRKANNRRLATNVFGPAEAARAERLSAKLAEIAKQPKPEKPDIPVEAQEGDAEEAKEEREQDETTMEIDSGKPSKVRIGSNRIGKRKQKKSKIVFQKYSDRQAAKRKKSTK